MCWPSGRRSPAVESAATSCVQPDPFPERFERELTSTEAEWQRALQQALQGQPWQLQQQGAWVRLSAGGLQLRWQPQPPRRLAALRLPVLRVCFAFDGVPAAQRTAFMQRFDLYLQRGGG